jgi:hypothetical protein
VRFSARGFSCPQPTADMRFAATTCFTMAAITAVHRSSIGGPRGRERPARGFLPPSHPSARRARTWRSSDTTPSVGEARGVWCRPGSPMWSERRARHCGGPMRGSRSWASSPGAMAPPGGRWPWRRRPRFPWRRARLSLPAPLGRVPRAHPRGVCLMPLNAVRARIMEAADPRTGAFRRAWPSFRRNALA